MNELERQIQERLAQGPVPAAEFMALALYHPQHGYYRRAEGPWGFDGKDYYTALDAGPLLGETLALRLESVWEQLDRPARFTVLEPGAGRGWLGRDLLAAAAGGFGEALRYLHQDDNPAARKAAETALAPWFSGGQASFLDEAEAPGAFQGAVVSNELFDALPAQPWRWDGSRWVREVRAAAGSEWQAADPGAAGEWFCTQGEALEPGDGSVWCEALPSLVARLTSGLARGMFLAIDYGDSAANLLGKGADLRRFRGHRVDGRWWEDPGESDLTADVDFTRLGGLLQDAGLRAAPTVSLGRWIREHAPLGRWEAEWQALPETDRVARAQNLLQLTMPGLLGERFRVLEAFRL